MNYSVKSIGCLSTAKLNSFGKNNACQPLRDETTSYKVKFGNGESQVFKSHGDSFKKSDKSNQDTPTSFGQRFINAAKQIAEKFKGKDASASQIGKGLGESVYGVKVS